MECPLLPYSYLHSPEFLRLSLHIVSVFGIPVHVYGGYCILFKTPDQMKSVKMTMFNLHFWSSLMDMCLSLFTIPYILLPSLSGVPLGFLHFLGVSVPIQVYTVLTVIGITGVAILQIFENRYHKIIFEKSISNRNTTRFLFYLFNYTLVLSFTIPTMLLIPDQVSAKNLLLDLYPCQFDADRFFVIAVDVRITHFFVTATCVIIEAQLAFFVVRLLIYLRTGDEQRSKRTRNLQKRLFIAICIQVSVPILLMATPFLYIILGMSFGYHNQALNNISIIAISTHGFLSTIVMLIVHKPYRDATFRFLNVSQIISRSSGHAQLHIVTT